MLKKAVILAGGRGTRLSAAFPGVPKPLVPLAGVPLAERLVRQLVEQGFEDITLTVHHDAERIRAHFGNGSAFSCRINYLEESIPMGSAGILHRMAESTHEPVLVVYGDVLADVDWQRMGRFHAEHRADATLLIHPNDHPHDSDLVVLDPQQRVTQVLSKPHPEERQARNAVNAGAYILEPGCWSHIPSDRPSDFGGDLLPTWCRSMRVFAYNTPEYIKDMGTPERLKQGEWALESGRTAARSLRNPQVAVFLDRDGVINEDTDLIHRPEDFHLFPWTASAIKKLNKSPFLSIVITNQSVIARGLTDEAGLDRIHAKMDWELGQSGAFLDALYFCPHHPDGGFPGEVAQYKTVCSCRKPKPGMLLAAAERFGIDLKRSWMIGDSARDVGAARAAGVTAVGVRTGHGLKNSTEQPDFLFDHLGDAVDYLIEQPFNKLFNDCLQQIENHLKTNKSPYIVALAGPARSGKSTAAAGLARELKLQGISASVVSLDAWIRPESERSVADFGPWKSYPQVELERAMTQLLEHCTPVHAPGYALRAGEQPRGITFSPDASVLIVEGVVALSLEAVRKNAHETWAITADPALRRERFERYQTWRGKTVDWEEWERREREEVRAVEKDLIFAQTHINL